MISAALLCQAAGLTALQPRLRHELAPALLTADSQGVLGALGVWEGAEDPVRACTLSRISLGLGGCLVAFTSLGLWDIGRGGRRIS